MSPAGAAPWEPAMRAALVQAQRPVAQDDVPVGAVVLGGTGEVVATGHNVRERDGDPAGHAELVALQGGIYAGLHRSWVAHRAQR